MVKVTREYSMGKHPFKNREILSQQDDSFVPLFLSPEDRCITTQNNPSFKQEYINEVKLKLRFMTCLSTVFFFPLALVFTSCVLTLWIL